MKGLIVMKKNWLVFILLVTVLLTSCAGEKAELYEGNPPQLEAVVAEYYDSLGITEEVRKNAEAVYVTCMINEEKEVMLRLPEYWQDIYVIQENAGIDVYEKFNYDVPDGWELGNLWRINTMTHEDFAWYLESGMYENPYAEILGANTAVIGTDEDYVYMLSLPTDVQSALDIENAWEYYKAAMSNKEKFIDEFLKINDITKNESAPSLN